MKVNIRADSVVIEGYVNAIERDSKPLWSRMGQFIERICKGAFKKALQRNNDVKILLNHNPDRVLGSTAQGNLELNEDNIGLHARATITDKEVIEKAKRGELVGWSFGFYDRSVIKRVIDGMLHRNVEDLDLDEVSILDNTKTPAYDGTLIMARDADGEMQFRSEPFIDDNITVTAEAELDTAEETPEQERFNPNHNPNNGQFAPSGGSGGGAGGNGGSGEKWDYRGAKQQTDKIETAVKDAKTGRQAQAAYKAIKNHESGLLAEIKRVESGLETDGDVKVLYAQLRKVRKLKKDLLSKEIIGQRTQELIDDIELDDAFTETETPAEEKREEETQPKQQEIVENNIDYSEYEKMINEMKGD